MAASRSRATIVRWRIQPVRTGRSRIVASTIVPVSPIPPIVAANNAAFSAGEQVSVCPSGSTSLSDSTCAPKPPSR